MDLTSTERGGRPVSDVPVTTTQATPKSSAYYTAQSRLIIIYALFIRDFDYRFRVSMLYGLAVILEPLALVAIVSGIRVFFYSTMPIYGDSVVLFHATGIFPFQLFLICSAGVVRTRLDLDDYPVIHDIDIVTARFLVELFDIIIVTILFFIGMYLCGLELAAPFDPLRALWALLLLAAFSFGVGLINSSIESVFHIWRPIWASVSRSFMLLSGVLFVAALMPPWNRDWLIWNPLIHGIDYFRSAFYPQYPTTVLSLTYLIYCALGALGLGTLLFINRRDA